VKFRVKAASKHTEKSKDHFFATEPQRLGENQKLLKFVVKTALKPH
jgi:hypothetical protein